MLQDNNPTYERINIIYLTCLSEFLRDLVSWCVCDASTSNYQARVEKLIYIVVLWFMALYGLASAYGGTWFVHIHGSSCLEIEGFGSLEMLITTARLQITIFIMKTSNITDIFLISRKATAVSILLDTYMEENTWS